MKNLARHAWETACHEVSAIIYGTYLRRKLNPRFSNPSWERVGPYLFQSNQFSAAKKIVRFTAFFPSPKNNSKSVYWTSKLIDHFIWSIGQRHVAPFFVSPIKGRADLRTSSIYAIPGLAIKLTSKPHPRHADIVGWKQDRRETRLQAEKLADEATFVPSPTTFIPRLVDIQQDKRRLRIAGAILIMCLTAAAVAIGDLLV